VSDILTHSQCPECARQGHDSSGKHLGTFENGNQYCVVCEYKTYAGGDTSKREEVPVVAGDLLQNGTGNYEAIPSRKLTKETCQKYGIRTKDGRLIFELRDADGNIVCQKIKSIQTGKRDCKGDQTKAVMFGRHLFKAGGKRIIVTEGELDAPSVYQTISNKSAWPVVSIIGGAGGSKTAKEIKKNFDYLNSFDEVVFCFDNDEAGKEATKSVVGLFPPGKVFVTKLTYNDPSDYLQKSKSQDLYKDVWASPAWRPDGIVSISEVPDRVELGDTLRYRSPVMTMKMLGRKPYTMTGLVSGTGSGKTTIVYQQTEQDLKDGVKVGGIFLEGSPTVTLQDLAGITMGVRVRQILAQRELIAQFPELQDYAEYEDNLDDEELAHVIHEIKKEDNLVLLDHFGRADPKEILQSIEHLSVGMGCQEIVLDHISKVQCATNSDLDDFVDALQSLTKRLPSHLTIVSQLNQGDGSSTHEQGKRTTLKDIRGSQKVVSSFDEIIAFSRNQTAECDEERNTVVIDSLKNRIGGYTGHIENMVFNTKTGRLSPANEPFTSVTAPTSEPNFKVENMT